MFIVSARTQDTVLQEMSFSERCEGPSQRAPGRVQGRTAGLHFSIAELNRSEHEQ